MWLHSSWMQKLMSCAAYDWTGRIGKKFAWGKLDWCAHRMRSEIDFWRLVACDSVNTVFLVVSVQCRYGGDRCLCSFELKWDDMIISALAGGVGYIGRCALVSKWRICYTGRVSLLLWRRRLVSMQRYAECVGHACVAAVFLPMWHWFDGEPKWDPGWCETFVPTIGVMWFETLEARHSHSNGEKHGFVSVSHSRHGKVREPAGRAERQAGAYSRWLSSYWWPSNVVYQATAQWISFSWRSPDRDIGQMLIAMSKRVRASTGLRFLTSMSRKIKSPWGEGQSHTEVDSLLVSRQRPGGLFYIASAGIFIQVERVDGSLFRILGFRVNRDCCKDSRVCHAWYL